MVLGCTRLVGGTVEKAGHLDNLVGAVVAAVDSHIDRVGHWDLGMMELVHVGIHLVVEGRSCHSLVELEVDRMGYLADMAMELPAEDSLADHMELGFQMVVHTEGLEEDNLAGRRRIGLEEDTDRMGRS